MKALDPDDIREIGARIILSNTYHLALRPGHERIRTLGGLHAFMGWDRAILTDSGGFQVVSLASHRSIDEDGVTFRSHLDGSTHRFTPEHAIAVQEALGADEEIGARFGEREMAGRALQELHAEALLEAPQLDAEGGLRDPEPRGGPRQAALVGDRPEVAEVVVVQERHGSHL